MGYRLANPVAPGPFLKSEIIEPLGLSVTDASKVLGVTRPTLSALLNGRSSLSAEMALRVEKAFGVPMDILLRMQISHDVAALRRRDGDIKVARYKPTAAQAAKAVKAA